MTRAASDGKSLARSRKTLLTQSFSDLQALTPEERRQPPVVHSKEAQSTLSQKYMHLVRERRGKKGEAWSEGRKPPPERRSRGGKKKDRTKQAADKEGMDVDH